MKLKTELPRGLPVATPMPLEMDKLDFRKYIDHGGQEMKKKTDKELMQMILADKERYTIVVDNDAVWIQDNQKDEEDENYWVGFHEYGYNLIPIIFEGIGVKSEFV